MDKQDLKKMDIERARRFISKVEFREATTYKDTHPHEYIVRTKLNPIGQVEFWWMLFAINRNGVWEHFFHQEKPYWEIDGFKYWMNIHACFTDVKNGIDQVIIINRKPV